MSTCINRSHKDVVKLVEDTGLEVTTVTAIISLWQKNNMVDTFPTLEQFQEYKAQIQGKGFSDMYDPYFRFIADALLDNWTGVKGGESVSGLLKRFKRSISDKSGDSEVVLPEDALRHLLRVVEVGEGATLGEGGVITPQSLAAAVNALNGYLTTSEIYLRGMVSGLNDFLKSEEATPKQKISAIFHTHETALNYKRQLDAIFPKKGTTYADIADFYLDPSYEPLLAIKGKMERHIENIKDAYDNQLKNEVVETLYNLIKHNAPAVEEQYDKEISRFEKLLSKATRPGDIRYLKRQIEYEKEQKKANVITKQNIAKWLADPSVSWTGLMFRSSIYQQDAGTSLIGRYITDALEEAKKEVTDSGIDIFQDSRGYYRKAFEALNKRGLNDEAMQVRNVLISEESATADAALKRAQAEKEMAAAQRGNYVSLGKGGAINTVTGEVVAPAGGAEESKAQSDIGKIESDFRNGLITAQQRDERLSRLNYIAPPSSGSAREADVSTGVDYFYSPATGERRQAKRGTIEAANLLADGFIPTDKGSSGVTKAPTSFIAQYPDGTQLTVKENSCFPY